MLEELSRGTARKYIMVSGKGGVGKTSLAASLGVRLAMEGHTVLVVSTDPAHSLGDSLEQDLSGGRPVPVEGTSLPLWGMEIDPEQAKEELRREWEKEETQQKARAARRGAMGVVQLKKTACVRARARPQALPLRGPLFPMLINLQVEDWTSQVGLRGVLEQLTDLKLGELLDTPPPGLDEAIAISKVVQFVNSEEYAKFTRIIFDTAPTGACGAAGEATPLQRVRPIAAASRCSGMMLQTLTASERSGSSASPRNVTATAPSLLPLAPAGHTLRLLSLPDFLDRSIEKISRLRRKVAGAGSFVRVMFGRGAEALDRAVDQMEGARASVAQVRDGAREGS